MIDPLETLKLRFRARCASDRDALQRLEGEPAAVSPAGLKTMVHQMSGAAGAFGFPRLSAAALRLDDQLSAGEPPSHDNLQALIDELGRL